MRVWVAAFLVLVAASAAAQQPERVLLPAYYSEPVFAYDGAKFETVLWMNGRYSATGDRYLPADGRSAASIEGSRDGRFVYVLPEGFGIPPSHPASAFLSLQLIAGGARTRIPVVRERDFLSVPSAFPYVTGMFTWQKVRTTVRIYLLDAVPPPPGAFRVTLYSYEVAYMRDLPVVFKRAGDDASHPWYAVVDVPVFDPPCLRYGRSFWNCPTEKAKLVLEPPAGIRYWPLLSTVDNVTGQVRLDWID